MVSVKVYLNAEDFYGKEEIRRFKLQADFYGLFETLKEKLKILFPILKAKPFDVLYKDQDDEFITVSSEEEIAFAISMLANKSDNDHPLRLYVRGTHYDREEPFKLGCEAADVNQDGKSDEGVCLHVGVTCDGCRKNIRGFRYKCLQCPDFDLCHLCEDKRLHPYHVMLRLPTQQITDCFRLPSLCEALRVKEAPASKGPCVDKLVAVAAAGTAVIGAETAQLVGNDAGQFNKEMEESWNQVLAILNKSPTFRQAQSNDSQMTKHLFQNIYNNMTALLQNKSGAGDAPQLKDFLRVARETVEATLDHLDPNMKLALDRLLTENNLDLD